jgi:DNA-binding XRE family transcriptional regulator
VRIGAESAEKFDCLLFSCHGATIAQTSGKRKDKIPAIAGFMRATMSADCLSVATRPAHRKPLGQAIRRYRKQAKMTQERLGELADLNPKYIGEVERMEKTISVDALARVASALKVRVRDLVREI